ncbi:molybdopterin-synthase adenylyltransferase MoeB [Paraglaciecola aquimarina]|uniref:Molybdopterin-synthase adenylyltransferase MoeB n=1 Tax=Paraglaciecola algarum TaxID=3050085 RepID=A0ABS9DC78_9ALTE|nr:molybdopterin-synthase adenylyltransferase MoeB [Paraglaciecola sp. G1-23]MCF2950344.1 molybdopterin-synthase adenylyltransferase MoeB [Paraglaciecola sp. G1-23]
MSNILNKKTLTTQQAMRYSRQILLPGFDLEKQEILLNSKVLVIGVGGLGCAAAQYLVAAGIGGITIVDDDSVELSNLHRQVLHGEADLGDTKCQSAKRALMLINPNCKINCVEKRLDHQELCSQALQHQIILDCSDNLATRNILNQVSISQKVPLVSGAAIRMEGQICTFIPHPDNACYECLSELFVEQNLSCVEAGVMSPLVGVIGAMQALEAIKVLTGFGEPLANKLMLFDASSMNWQTFKIAKNPDCNTCKI